MPSGSHFGSSSNRATVNERIESEGHLNADPYLLLTYCLGDCSLVRGSKAPGHRGQIVGPGAAVAFDTALQSGSPGRE